ncbi:Uncharacterised protein [uncultured Clostridium sp.]|nr:Uncharacterised protein [uncultured Clostridium sp.]
MKKSTRSFAALPMALVLLCPPVCIAQAQGTFAAPGPQPEQGLLLCALALGLAGLATAIALLVLLLRRYRRRLEGNLAKPRRALPICMAVFGALSLATGGIMAVNILPRAQAYAGAVNALAHRELDLCEQQLAQLPEDYADTTQLYEYLHAARLAQQEEFEAAARAFTNLGDYRDAAARSIDCRVDHAWKLMDEENYKQASKAFAALQKEGVSGVEDCDKEADLRYALQLQDKFFQSGSYNDAYTALNLYRKLADAGYENASERLQQFRKDAFDRAKAALSATPPGGNLSYPYALFMGADGYGESDIYLEALDLQGSPYISARQKCQQFMADYWSFPELRDMVVHSDWMLFYLDGTWTNGNKRFDLELSSDDKSFYIEQNLVQAGQYPRHFLRGNEYYGEDINQHLLLTFTPHPADTGKMTVRNHTTSEQTTLTRQR